MMHAPVLTGMAVVAGIAALIANRFIIRAVGDQVPRGAVAAFTRWGALPRNIAAIAALVALSLALLELLRSRNYVPLMSRIGMAGFAGILLPTLTLATILPQDRITPFIVLFATGAAHVLTVLLGVAALRWRAPGSIRAAVGAITTSAFLAFASIVIALVGQRMSQSWSYSVSGALRHAGEMAWLFSLVAAAPTLLPRPGEPRFAVSATVAALVAAFVGAAFVAGGGLLGASFADVLYGAFRVDLFLPDGTEALGSPLVYALPLGIGAGVAAGGLVSGEPANRQTSMAVCMLLLAGFAPRSPITLLYLTLGIALFCRTLIAHGALMTVRGVLPAAPVREAEEAPREHG